MDSGSNDSKPEISQPWQDRNGVSMHQTGKDERAERSKRTSPKVREIADVETIGSCGVARGVAKVTTVSSTLLGVWGVIAFEASWLGKEVCGPWRTLLGLTACPASTDARGATGSGAGLFLEADGGESGWFGVVTLSEVTGLESPRVDCVSSLEVSLMETCRKGRVSTSMFTKAREINQGMNQHTCEFSGEGLRRFKILLLANFFTAVLVLVGTLGAAGSEVALLLEADFGEIGWFCITTFFRDGEFLQKRTTGAGGKNLNGEPSSFVGSGPSCCCKEIEQVSKRIIGSCETSYEW
jgi:hypothetical protein